jgi:hypothetical protein
MHAVQGLGFDVEEQDGGWRASGWAECFGGAQNDSLEHTAGPAGSGMMMVALAMVRLRRECRCCRQRGRCVVTSKPSLIFCQHCMYD